MNSGVAGPKLAKFLSDVEGSLPCYVAYQHPILCGILAL